MKNIHGVTLQDTYQLFIGGQWRDASDGAVFKTKCPADGEILAECAQATREDVDAAVAAAKAAGEQVYVIGELEAGEKGIDLC